MGRGKGHFWWGEAGGGGKGQVGFGGAGEGQRLVVVGGGCLNV